MSCFYLFPRFWRRSHEHRSTFVANLFKWSMFSFLLNGRYRCHVMVWLLKTITFSLHYHLRSDVDGDALVIGFHEAGGLRADTGTLLIVRFKVLVFPHRWGIFLWQSSQYFRRKPNNQQNLKMQFILLLEKLSNARDNKHSDEKFNVYFYVPNSQQAFLSLSHYNCIFMHRQMIIKNIL